MEIFDWIKENWVQITVIYLALIKFLTTIRDAIDKTPQTDDNWFEKMCTFLGKVGGALIAGKRVQ